MLQGCKAVRMCRFVRMSYGNVLTEDVMRQGCKDARCKDAML